MPKPSFTEPCPHSVKRRYSSLISASSHPLPYCARPTLRLPDPFIDMSCIKEEWGFGWQIKILSTAGAQDNVSTITHQDLATSWIHSVLSWVPELSTTPCLLAGFWAKDIRSCRIHLARPACQQLCGTRYIILVLLGSRDSPGH